MGGKTREGARSRSRTKKGGRESKVPANTAPAIASWVKGSSGEVLPGLYELTATRSSTDSLQRMIVNFTKVEPSFPSAGRLTKGFIVIGEEQSVDSERGAKTMFHICSKIKCTTEMNSANAWHVVKLRPITEPQLRLSNHWGRSLHTRLTRVDDMRAEYKERIAQKRSPLSASVPGANVGMDPSAFGGGQTLERDGSQSAAAEDDGDDDQRAHLVSMAHLWTDRDWKSASRQLLGRLIATPGVSQALLNRATASLSVDEPSQKPVDPMARLLELLEGRHKKKGHGVFSDDEDDEEMSVRKRSGREIRLALHKSHPGLLTKRTLKDIIENSGAAWALGAADLQHLLTHIKSTQLTQMPALFRLHGSRTEIMRGNNVRNKRELQTLTLALDLIVGNQPSAAADVLCQRLKALEVAHLEQKWDTAELLELIHPEQGLLADREELLWASKELAVTAKHKLGRPAATAPKKPWTPKPANASPAT